MVNSVGVERKAFWVASASLKYFSCGAQHLLAVLHHDDVVGGIVARQWGLPETVGEGAHVLVLQDRIEIEGLGVNGFGRETSFDRNVLRGGRILPMMVLA
jgi:hypothetical protein